MKNQMAVACRLFYACADCAHVVVAHERAIKIPDVVLFLSVKVHGPRVVL